MVYPIAQGNDGVLMKILVLNASPKGKFSTTLQTALYLQALHPEHEFTFLPVGQRIKSYEKDSSPVRDALTDAELVLFCYPVYTFTAPYQLHRLIELIKADGIDLSGKKSGVANYHFEALLRCHRTSLYRGKLFRPRYACHSRPFR